ncbi:hypothetical protein BDV40DRAFT_120535 [Aspergillus tamarii]|uniref:Uncharacterized protein n=1 Tax=Aspergillus tamarii TaxID=41984 RepID=A0A5N6V2F0_ASPTM|nr:hypothetical protein BDV40DRAFT_120535 [Aspergillus tamarii]
MVGGYAWRSSARKVKEPIHCEIMTGETPIPLFRLQCEKVIMNCTGERSRTQIEDRKFTPHGDPAVSRRTLWTLLWPSSTQGGPLFIAQGSETRIEEKYEECISQSFHLDSGSVPCHLTLTPKILLFGWDARDERTRNFAISHLETGEMMRHNR